MAIQYVGGKGGGRAGATTPLSVSLSSGLSGGIASGVSAGDLVIVTVAVGTQGRNPTCAVSGYTALTQQHTTATTYDISVCTSYKFMPTTPDANVSIPSTGNIADGQGYEIHVFRGVDPTTPLDGVTPTYATGSGTNNRPDPAAITPATAGAWIYCGGGGAASSGTTVFTSTSLEDFLSHNGADTNDGTVGAGYYSGWTSGSWNCAQFGGGSVNAANSWGATTLVLRPEAVVYELTGNDLTLGAPLLASSALAQNHILVGIALALGAPELSLPTLTVFVNVVLEALGITLGAPVLAGPALAQVHALVANALLLGSPELHESALGQNHVLASDDISVGALALAIPNLVQQHALESAGISLGAPILGVPAISQEHAFSSLNLTVGALELGLPSLSLPETGGPHRTSVGRRGAILRMRRRRERS